MPSLFQTCDRFCRYGALFTNQVMTSLNHLQSKA
jgi:hypothetical protein